MAALLLLSSFAFVHLMALPVFADEAGPGCAWIWRVIEAGEWLQPLGEWGSRSRHGRWCLWFS